MSSSADAFPFFNEWMKSKRNLILTATFGEVVVSGTGRIEAFDERLFVADSASRFSISVPLEGSIFEASDPERSVGFPALDEALRDTGFNFAWEILLPSGGRVVIAEVDARE